MILSSQKLHQAMQAKSAEKPALCLLKAILAGTYIGIGGLLFTIATHYNSSSNGLKLFGAILFCVGLNLVVFLKAQLFTGNNLMLFSVFRKKLKWGDLATNWIIVYLGNLIGSLLFILFVNFFLENKVQLVERFIEIVKLKTNYNFFTAFYKAIFCNILVCLAIYFTVIARNLWQKLIGILVPITCFVYLGFEHSIANMFFLPIGLYLSDLNIEFGTQLFVENIIPVTLGNIIGGLILSIVLLKVGSDGHTPP